MSKAIIERIFARELNKDTTNKLWLADMRKHFGGQYPHKWVITKELLETTFGFNTVYALHAGKTQDEIFKLYGLKSAKMKRTEAVEEAAADLVELEGKSEYWAEGAAEQEVAQTTPEEQIAAWWVLIGKVEDEIIKAAADAATDVYKQLPKVYNRSRKGKAGRIYKHLGHIEIIQTAGLFENTKVEIVNIGYDSIVKSLKGKKFKGESLKARKPGKKITEQGAQFQKFSRATQFHHEELTTVSASAFAKVMRNLRARKAAGEELDIADMGLINSIGTEGEDDFFGPIELHWKAVKDAVKGKQELTDTYYVEGHIGPRPLNPRGSEDTDWTKLGPRLMKSLEKQALKDKDLQDLVTKDGSKSYAQRLQERAISIGLTELALGVKRGGGKPRVQKRFTEEKPHEYRGISKGGGKGRSKTKKGIPKSRKKVLPSRRSKKTSQTRRTTSNNISLIALLQAKLPQTVMKNMTGARLHNQTGTFAGSVKAITMGKMAGKPNIVYTYEEDPYQVFEMGGRGNSKWATPKRDPRYIINLSIREIAAKMMAGKFTTTRT